MNPFLDFVKGIERQVADAKRLSVAGSKPVETADAKVAIFAPHPDDECIIGLLPYRLMRERGMQVVNVPVTFGSNPDRQEARAAELADACAYLGWEMFGGSPTFQSLEVEDVVRVLEALRPQVILFPHVEDWNSRHVSTHHLLVEALGRLPESFSCTVVETEFWGAMDDPNLMVEGTAEDVAELVAATSLHTGEVARNPYHLLLPAWMQDNVRRGGELVGGQGGAVPDFAFATLYRLRRWRNGGFEQVLERGTHLAAGPENLKELF